MLRLGYAAVLGLLLLAAPPASAQGSKDDLKKLEANLAKLKEQVKDMEARLLGAKEAAAKSVAGKRDGKHGMAHWAGHHGGWAGHHGAWAGYGKHGMHGWAGHGKFASHWAGHSGWFTSQRGDNASVEHRLDRIMRELAYLRRDLHKQK